MKHLFLGVAVAAFVTACGSVTNTDALTDQTVTAEVQTKIPESFTIDMRETMRKHNLKGFSLAVFENYEIVYSQQWGVKASTSEELIDGETAFSTASMAKPVTALLCIMLAEKGRINLDDPISDYLKRWSLPQSKFTRDTPITWKHLLSHMAGTTQHGFADFYDGDDIPTLIDSLQGKLPRYNNKPIDVTFKPGSDWKYSGGGYSIIQMALEDHLQKPLHVLASETIFQPLGLKNTTLTQPNEIGFLMNVASVHNRDGDVIRSGLPITPQVAASGLWSTPEDLATLSLAIQKALRGDKDTIITPSSAKIATNIISLKSSGGNTLGWARAFGFGNTDWLRLEGSNTGVGGDLLVSMDDGYGFAFLANGEKRNRFPVFSYVRGEVIDRMQWGKADNKAVAETTPASLITSITGTYRDFLYGENLETRIINDGGVLYLESAIFQHFIGKMRSQMVYLGDNTFKILDYPNTLRFNLDGQNTLTSITLERHNDPRLSETIGLDKLQPTTAQ